MTTTIAANKVNEITAPRTAVPEVCPLSIAVVSLCM
jgi:hypothetical protein